jgi:signal transduction histidine kinase
MIVRSLRWRLVFATVLIIAAMIAAVGVFSSVTVKREFDRFLIAQKLADHQRALEILRTTRDVRRVHAETGLGTVVFDANNRVIARWPPSLEDATIRLEPDGALRIERRRKGRFEAIKLKGNAHPVAGLGMVYLLPSDKDRPPEGTKFRLHVDRWLIAGLALAALVAVLVTISFFRRVFAPVEELTRGAQALASGRLDTRVAVRGDDEIGRLAQSFNAMADALERNERARRNMVSDVAHELRTPLTNIRVQIEAVQDGVLEADAKFFASIEEDATTLAQLVDDLQQLSLAEAGQLRLELAEVSVQELIERALPIPPTGIAIRTDIAPLTIRADARRLLQVLRNLLANAIKYARTTIDVSAVRTGETIEIRVSDDGPGVPPEHTERIFDRFYRADASRSRTTGGAGLGLAIARELVELHGGTIRLEGRSTFIISLPPVRTVVP